MRILSHMRSSFTEAGEDASEVLRGASSALLIRGFGALLSFLFNVAIARLLGAEGTGQYYLALSFATIGALIARLGLDNALLRFVSDAYAAGDFARAKAVAKRGLSIAAVTAPLLALLGLFSANPIATVLYDKPELAPYLRWASVAIVSVTFQILLAQIVRGAKKIAYSSIVSAVIQPLTGLALLFPAVYFLDTGGPIVAFFLATALAAMVGAMMWHRISDNAPSPAASFPLSELVPSVKALFVTSLVQNWLVPWAPVTVLGMFYSSHETGIFAAATRFGALMTFFLASVNLAIAPKFAELHRIAATDRLKKVARRFSLIVLVGTSPIMMVFIFAGDWAMGLFGPEFRPGGQALSILALGQAINIATGSVGFILIMGGQERIVRNSAIVSALVLVVGLGLLVPPFAAVGAAAASVLAIVSANLMNAFFVWKKFGFAVYPRLG